MHAHSIVEATFEKYYIFYNLGVLKKFNLKFEVISFTFKLLLLINFNLFNKFKLLYSIKFKHQNCNTINLKYYNILTAL